MAAPADEVELTQCPICMEEYEDGPHRRPVVVTPCGHSICEHCLGQVVAKQAKEKLCPMCRENIPQGTVCPINWGMLDALRRARACEARLQREVEHRAREKAETIVAKEHPQVPRTRLKIDRLIGHNQKQHQRNAALAADIEAMRTARKAERLQEKDFKKKQKELDNREQEGRRKLQRESAKEMRKLVEVRVVPKGISLQATMPPRPKQAHSLHADPTALDAVHFDGTTP